MEEQTLVPSTTHEIDFYGDLLLVAFVNDVAYVALKPISDFLGLDWPSQHSRTQRDNVLKEESRVVVTTSADGKQRKCESCAGLSNKDGGKRIVAEELCYGKVGGLLRRHGCSWVQLPLCQDWLPQEHSVKPTIGASRLVG